MLTRRLVTVLAMTAALIVGACSSSPESGNPDSGGDYSLHVVGFRSDQAFWKALEKGALQAGTDFGVKVNYSAPTEGSDAGMIALLETGIAQNADGFGIAYTGKAMEEITTRAIETGAEVVLFNNNRFEGDNAPSDSRIRDLAYVGQNETFSGEVIATAFLRHLPQGGGRVLVVNTNPKAFVLTLRNDGVDRVLKANGYSPDVLVGNNDATQTQQLVGAYLQANPDTVGVLTLSVAGAPAATKAVQDLESEIPVATFDINDVVYELIKTDTPLKLCLNQQPYLQGYYTVQNLAMALKNGFAPVNVNTGSLIVEKSNIEQVGKLIEQGLD